jgi:hypothetical protein
MTKDAGAETARTHLRAEANAEKRLALLQRHADPVTIKLTYLVSIVRMAYSVSVGGKCKQLSKNGHSR